MKTKTKQKAIRAYHFTGDKLRDGRPIPPIGEWLVHTGPLVPCESGLHASRHPFDALQYAQGNLLHLVELSGKIVPHGNPEDKVVARKRRIIKTINAEPVMRKFACWCALSVIHLWDAPDIVVQYLKTRDESIRDAVWDAALVAERDAACISPWAAARAAAVAAARAAACISPWAAAEAAARDAASAAARAPAWDAASAAAWAAAWDAARAAAVAAAWDAARAAAVAAAGDAQRKQFKKMVDEAFKKES
jgi:hypothetical protein